MPADSEAREALRDRTILLVPYCHADWAWTHSRRWHEMRYVLAVDEVLDIMAEQDEAGIEADAPEAYRWYTDCFRTQIAAFLHARPERVEELRQRIDEGRIAALVREHFDLRPYNLIHMLDLVRPIYRKTAAYGHFGRELPEFTWERTDKAEVLRDAAGL